MEEAVLQERIEELKKELFTIRADQKGFLRHGLHNLADSYSELEAELETQIRRLRQQIMDLDKAHFVQPTASQPDYSNWPFGPNVC